MAEEPESSDGKISQIDRANYREISFNKGNF